MDESTFLALCSEKGYPQHAVILFEEAVKLAQSFLIDKKRLAGDSLFDHNLRTATILVENKAAPEIVLAGILQGIQQEYKEQEIAATFGPEIIQVLHGIEEIKAIRAKNRQLDAEGIRKIILTTLKDVRVILIKLANKIDNLQSIRVFSLEEQTRIAHEVLGIYAPLASRLGVEKMKIQLEDSACQILHPAEFKQIQDFLRQSSEERQAQAQQLMEKIKEIAQGQVEIIKMKGRPKHIYSIYRKLQTKGATLHELYDLLGVRVIVPEIKDCYTVLGLLHETFEPLPDRLKDYIANPKANLYRSIHTAVRLPNGKTAEIQIRTPEMDEFAEEGIAAHWRYKGIKSEQSFEKKISWLRNVLDLQQDLGTKELLETVKVDIFGDKMYCYTPKGDVKELPVGATLLDFAYLVHEDIGNHAVGGRVNGKFVPLKQVLVLGDVVEIVTDKSQRPRRGWLKIVTSARAKQKIRKSLKEHEKLPALHYHVLKSEIAQEQGVLVQSREYAHALCGLAQCCSPLPGEEIIGIFTKRRIISIHRTDCHRAIKEQERWLNVQWKDTFNQRIRFSVIAEERSGLLAEVLHTIASAGFEVKEAKAKLVGNNNVECSFTVIPRDLEQLKELITRVKKVRGVRKIVFE